MPNSKKILSKKIFIALGLIYLLNLIMDGRLAALFVLETGSLIKNFEFWRLLTFPLASGRFEAVLLAFYAFFYISPKLEEQLRNPFYTALIILLICLQGILFTIVFWKYNITVAGLEGISFFIITLFTLLNQKYSIKFSVFLHLKLLYLTLFVVISWIAIKLLIFNIFGQINDLYSSCSFIFGTVIGIVAYLQILFYMQHIVIKSKNKPKVIMPTPEQLSLALLTQSRVAKLNSNFIDEFNSLEIDPSELNEDHLNQVLDKIIENGKDSLTIEELKFLDEYSKHIN